MSKSACAAVALFCCAANGLVTGSNIDHRHTSGGFRLTKQYLQENPNTLWNAFKSAHSKKYSKLDEPKRRSIYMNNMKHILDLQEQNPHASFGTDSVFADLTSEEFLQSNTGLMAATKPDPSTYHKFTDAELQTAAKHTGIGAVQENAQATDSDGTKLEVNKPCNKESIDLNWATAGAATHVRNQGSCGGCWAFSTVGAVEGQWVINGHPLTALSEQELISCARIMDLGGCKGGVMSYAFKWIVQYNKGMLTTAEAYPYADVAWVGPSMSTEECKTKEELAALPMGANVTGWRIYQSNEVDMYAGLMYHGPLTIAVDATAWQTYKGGILTHCGNPAAEVNHGVLLVGHGYDPASETEYWVIKNSWGPNWGEAGYIRLQFGLNLCLISHSPASVTVEIPPPTPGFVPVDPTPSDPDQHKIPAVIVYSPEAVVDPMASQDDTVQDSVCFYGKTCECKSVCVILPPPPHTHTHTQVGVSGKVGNLCAGVLVFGLMFGLMSLLFGAFLSRLLCARGLSEEQMREKLNEHKRRGARQAAVEQQQRALMSQQYRQVQQHQPAPMAS